MSNHLPSWNDGKTKESILKYLDLVTDPNQATFVPIEDRIAVFDNDGTLWCEKPMYIQLDYILRQLAGQAQSNPELRTRQPWQAAWKKDFAWLGSAITKHYQGDDSDLKVLLGGVLALANDQPVERIEAAAKKFVENERHPELALSYQDCVYKPMFELLRFLEANDFTNYIVSGGGRDFMRGFAQDLYSIPRERVIGSTVAYRFVESENGADILQKAELDVIDDGPGKPIQIWHVIGRRPILAAGNSNGDIEMLKFTQSRGEPYLNLLLLHDDTEREYAYQKGAEKALNLAAERDWQVISMKDDWNIIF